MDRDQLIDLTRRALKLARDRTTDLAPAEFTVAADDYTSAERHARDRAMLLKSPNSSGMPPNCLRRERAASRR